MFSFSRQTLGQKEDRIWYFGGDCTNTTTPGAGLDFNSGSPVPLTNSAMTKTESSATQSNRNGSLLFYTNGVDVFDKTHSVMLNGSGLGGHISSEQPAVIIPFVNDSSKFYLFAQDGQPTATGTGLHYSIIDITLNGGLGAVTATKAVLLQSGTSEFLTATKHQNGVDYWVITADYDSIIFNSYKVSSIGISAPVKTNLGFNTPAYLNVVFNNRGNKISFKAFNPSQTKLIRYIADFNLSTGLVSNKIPIDTGTFNINSPAEFSPNDSLFYSVTCLTASSYDVYQCKVYVPNIFATKQTILNTSTYPYTTDLKLGPNGKIYINRYCGDSIDVINSPNIYGIGCNYQKNVLYLAGKKEYFAFPNEIFKIPFLPLGVQENLSASDIFGIFPNPVSDYITISNFSSISEFTLADAKGQNVVSKKNLNADKIDISNIPDGYYFIKITSNGKHFHDKIVVRH